MAFPNGIVLVPGGKRLLMAESKKNRILEFPVLAPGKVGQYRVFAELPAKSGDQVDNQPDGMCLDADGNLYVAHYGMKQVQVLDPQGKLIARYPGGNVTTSNVAFGPPNWDQLYITGGLGAESSRGGLFPPSIWACQDSHPAGYEAVRESERGRPTSKAVPLSSR